MSVWDDLKQALQLVDDVKGLKSRIGDVARLLDETNERVLRLEEREELLIEKSRSAAREAAATAAQRMSENAFERVVRLEEQLRQSQTPHARLEPPGED